MLIKLVTQNHIRLAKFVLHCIVLLLVLVSLNISTLEPELLSSISHPNLLQIIILAPTILASLFSYAYYKTASDEVTPPGDFETSLQRWMVQWAMQIVAMFLISVVINIGLYIHRNNETNNQFEASLFSSDFDQVEACKFIAGKSKFKDESGEAQKIIALLALNVSVSKKVTKLMG